MTRAAAAVARALLVAVTAASAAGAVPEAPGAGGAGGGAPAAAPAAPGDADSSAATLAAGLGPFAPRLEGTWELSSLTLPSGEILTPPRVEGVVVVDGGRYLAAAYVLAAPGRKVGSLWEGEIAVGVERFALRPRTGFQYDSTARPRVRPDRPPPTSGRVLAVGDALVFVRADGAQVRWMSAQGRRIQVEPDGSRIEHRRTSLVPRVPAGLPGRQE